MTARQLIVIRHAKAASGPSDVDTPLTDKGRRDAAALGRWLAAQAITLDRAAVSPAVRARQSWEAVGSELREAVDTVTDERIYDNTVASLLDAIHDTPDEVTGLAVIGHNPGLGELAAALDDGAGDSAARQALAEGFATCTAAIFDVAGHWSAVQPDGLTLTALFTARASDEQ